MAKTFDPSQLSAADQSAFAQWQQSLRAYVQQNGGAIPAPVSYALAHPEYLQQHPELQEGYNIVSGATLPPGVREATKDFHPVWGTSKGGDAGMEKNSGLWNKWETWLQIGLGGAVAAPVVLPALGVGGAATAGTTGATAAGTGGAAGAAGAGTAGTAGAIEGGTTLGANLGGAGALGAGGAGATAAGTGGTLASTGTTGVMSGYPSAGAGISSAAPAGTSSWWKDLLGIGSKAQTARTVAGLAGNYLQSRQVDKAVQAQVDAANKALDLQSHVYQQQRADLAPYRNAGSASIGELSRLVGLPAGSDTTTPYFQQQAAAQQATAQQNQQAQNRQPPAAPSQAMPRSATIAGLAPTDQSGMVNMLSPDGRPARVPQSQVQSALAAGGRMAS